MHEFTWLIKSSERSPLVMVKLPTHGGTSLSHQHFPFYQYRHYYYHNVLRMVIGRIADLTPMLNKKDKLIF